MSGLAPRSGAGTSTSPVKHRPQTHKPRGICRYYNTQRGCFAGKSCKFLHGEVPAVDDKIEEGSGKGGEHQRQPQLTPYDQAKRCRYYANGFCRRGESCWFQHVLDEKGKAKSQEPGTGGESDSDSEGLFCSICFEQPVTFGLLGGCSHVFCITCIKQWRDGASKPSDMVDSGNTKKCPMCRTPSNYITPSSIFVKHGTDKKELIVRRYKESMARMPCKYFQKTKGNTTPMCPFGKDCFYKHENADGTLFVFNDGTDVCLPRYARYCRHASGRRNSVYSFDSDSDDDIGEFFPFPLDIDTIPFWDILAPNIGGGPANGGGADGGLGARVRILGGRSTTTAADAGAEPGPTQFLRRMRSLDRSWGNGTASNTTTRVAAADQATAGPSASGQNDNERNQTTGDSQGGVRDTARRLQEVGQSLEALNEAIQGGATLDRLNDAVEALRDRLGHLEEENAGGEGSNPGRTVTGGGGQGRRGRRNNPSRRRRHRDRLDEEERQEEEVMERLEILADQMLASIHVMREAEHMNAVPGRSETPPPPLEPIGTISSPNGHRHRHTPGRPALADSDEDCWDMPGLESVDNSSEDDELSESESGEEEGESDDDSLQGQQFFGGQRYSGPTEDEGDFADGLLAQYGPLLEFAARSASRTDADGGDELPELEPVDMDARTGEGSGSQEEAATTTTALSQSPQSSPMIVSEPPFVTDGRSRVVWTSPSQEPHHEQPPTTGSDSLRAAPPSIVPPASTPVTSPGNVVSAHAARPTGNATSSPTTQRRKSIGPSVERVGGAGFTTDGRGRVIGTSVASEVPNVESEHPTAAAAETETETETEAETETRPVEQDSAPSSESSQPSFLGRVFSVFY